jgi:hypothetical protein
MSAARKLRDRLRGGKENRSPETRKPGTRPGSWCGREDSTNMLNPLIYGLRSVQRGPLSGTKKQHVTGKWSNACSCFELPALVIRPPFSAAVDNPLTLPFARIIYPARRT